MASRANYYDFRSAKVAIALELMKRGWKVFDYKEDQSDMMTDYYDPANWGGIATKDGFVLVVDCYSNHNSGKEIRHYNYTAETALSMKSQKLIAKLEEMTVARGCSVDEERTAKEKIAKIREKENAGVAEKYIVTDVYPVYQKNPGRCSWHVEKDGTIIAKGTGVAKFRDMVRYDKSYNDYILANFEPGSYRYEKALEENELAKKFEIFLNKIDAAAGCMIGGSDKKGYVYQNITVTEYKTEKKAVPTTNGSIKDGQCFMIVSPYFNYGVCKGYVYKIIEVKSGNSSYLRAVRLDKKLSKVLTGTSNPANNFGIFGGNFDKQFLAWIDKNAISWCNIEEVKTPYNVQKCVKKAI